MESTGERRGEEEEEEEGQSLHGRRPQGLEPEKTKLTHAFVHGQQRGGEREGNVDDDALLGSASGVAQGLRVEIDGWGRGVAGFERSGEVGGK